MADQLGQKWGKAAIVENIAGGAMNVGAGNVARAAPDGYTLLVAPPAPLSFSHLLYKDLGYEPTKFVPITMLAKIPNVLVVRKELPAASLKELVEQWLDPAILGHQHGERRLGGAARAGDVAAQGLGRLVARRRERAAAGDRAARERPCELGGQAARDAGLGQALDQQEEIGRTAAGHRGDRVHQVLVVDPMNRCRPLP